MRRIFAAAVFVFSLFLSNAVHASDYWFSWQCHYTTCTFSANPVPYVLDYYWDFGDLTFGTQQSMSHTYTPCCGSDLYYPRVDLTYHMSNGSYIGRRCYVTYYNGGGIGGDPTPVDYSGIC